jgi:polar amino acid transport system substrate-binding protein
MTRTRLWTVLAFAFVLATALIAAGCGGDDDEEVGEPQLQQEGQILVGTDTPYPPFEIGQPPDITGYDIEVMNEIANRLDLNVKYQDTSFDTIFRDTGTGKFDTAAAASTITEGREGTVDFSDPYFEAQGALVVTPDSDIKTTDDLSGATVATQDATTFETYAQDETDAGEVRGFPEGPDAINAVATGQADAALIDQAVAVDAVEKQGGVEISEVIPINELFGFAFAQDNDVLREDVNGALQEMKDDGTIEELYQKYFKIKAPESVLEGTHEPT